MKRLTLSLLLALASASLGAQAAPPPPAGRQAMPMPAPAQGMPGMPGMEGMQGMPGMAHPQGDPLMQSLYPPEMVMHHQKEIGLQDAQRAKIVKEMSTAQAKFTEVQWTMSGEQDKLEQLVKATPVDEAAVLKQMDRIMAMEQDVHRTQLLLMVRVKNILTPEQQATLNGMKGMMAKH